MKELYKEAYIRSIKVGDTVCIKKDEKLLHGEISEIFSGDISGVKVEIVLKNDNGEFLKKEVGYIEYMIRDGNVEYATLK